MARNIQIDNLRGLAIILMLFGHSMNFSIGSENIVWNAIYMFHMPLFFIVSGYLMNPNDVGGGERKHRSSLQKIHRTIFVRGSGGYNVVLL